MTAKRFYYLLLVLLSFICVGLVGSVFVGNKYFKQQSEKLSQAKSEAQAVEDQKISLAQAKQDIAQYSELNEISKSIVPRDKDQAKTVREINKIASQSNITLSQITFQNSSLGQKTPATKTKSKISKTPPITQVEPVPGISGVFALEITINSSTAPIPYSDFLNFLEKLENNRRTAHVSSISVSPAETGGDVTFSLKLKAYLKP